MTQSGHSGFQDTLTFWSGLGPSKRHQLMALQAVMRATIINGPRSGPRANRCSLSHPFIWGPLQCRQLQHSGVLTLAQVRDQSDLPIGKLKRVVMHAWLV